MNSSISFFASVWLMNGRSTVTFGSLSTSVIERTISSLKITRPGVVRIELAVTAVLDRVLELHLAGVEGLLDLLLRREPLRPRLELRDVERRHVLDPGVREEVEPEHHVLRGRRQREAVRRREDVVRRQHEDAGLGLRLGRQRHVDGHLVAVEVGVERVADERVHLDRLALDEHRLERLDTEAVERRRAVQEHRMLGDHLLEDVPDLRLHRVDVLLRRLDVLDDLPLDEPAHDERLEELERHQLRQPALVELEVRAGDDHRPSRVVDALAEQVLAEAALLALEHVRERLQRRGCRARSPRAHGGRCRTVRRPLPGASASRC